MLDLVLVAPLKGQVTCMTVTSFTKVGQAVYILPSACTIQRDASDATCMAAASLPADVPGTQYCKIPPCSSKQVQRKRTAQVTTASAGLCAPVSSSYSVTPSAQMSTFSLQAGMSAVLMAPVTTASTGGSATTCTSAVCQPPFLHFMHCSVQKDAMHSCTNMGQLRCSRQGI